jgi:succinylarginine dihydrolase
MPRTESVGEENYRTHKFIEFKVTAPHYDVATVEGNKVLILSQGALKDLYVLHMTVKADLQGVGTKRVKGKKVKVEGVGVEHYLFLCQIFARSVRAENNRFKHIRQREIHELDTFAKGLNTGWMLNE